MSTEPEARQTRCARQRTRCQHTHLPNMHVANTQEAFIETLPEVYKMAAYDTLAVCLLSA